jgi:FHS family L-fucose permease-like MFS transporter
MLHRTGVVYALLGVEFFMSIVFSTIFSLGIRGLGSRTKGGSVLLIMAILGRAVLPVVMATYPTPAPSKLPTWCSCRAFW